jgi:IS5 family transposase
MLLPIHLLYQWNSLSDPTTEEALIEVPTMRFFAGIVMCCKGINQRRSAIQIQAMQ